MICAFDKITGRYVPVSKGKKGVKYNSGCCDGDLIFCKGEKNIPYFRHIDDKSTCNGGFNNQGETRLHKEAKKIVAEKLNENKTLTFEKKCNRCDYFTYQINLENAKCIEEYSFNFNGNKKIADVACVDGENISYIIEIKHTHGTKEEDRPEPWCEFKAEAIVIDNSFICLRDYLCQKCIDKEKQEIDDMIERKKAEYKRQEIREKNERERQEKELKRQREIEENERKRQEYIEFERQEKIKRRIVAEEYYKKKEEREKEELKKKWDDEAPIREAEEKKRIEKEKHERERIKKINDEAHLRVLEQIQLEKDIIEVFGEKRAKIMVGYMTRHDVEYHRELFKRCDAKKKMEASSV